MALASVKSVTPDGSVPGRTSRAQGTRPIHRLCGSFHCYPMVDGEESLTHPMSMGFVSDIVPPQLIATDHQWEHGNRMRFPYSYAFPRSRGGLLTKRRKARAMSATSSIFHTLRNPSESRSPCLSIHVSSSRIHGYSHRSHLDRGQSVDSVVGRISPGIVNE